MASSSLKNLTRLMPQNGMEDILEDMQTAESDRGAATLVCSTVEYALRMFLTKHMVELSAKEEDNLFFNSGALSDLGGMTAVAYAFGLIDPRFRDDLSLLRSIRNAFGHAPQRVTFDVEAIQVLCPRFHMLVDMAEPEKTPRGQFILAATMLLIALRCAGDGYVGLPSTLPCVALVPKGRRNVTSPHKAARWPLP